MDVFQAIATRRSVRAYASRPLPANVVQRMCRALRFAPSACNYQPWHFIFVTDPELRREVAQASYGQIWMAGAPVIVAACGFPRQAYQTMGGRFDSAAIDVAIALDHLTLAAVSEGLGTCWVGAFDEDRVKRLLKVPAEARVVALTPLGYPASPGLNHPLDESQRKSPHEIFSVNHYGKRLTGQRID